MQLRKRRKFRRVKKMMLLAMMMNLIVKGDLLKLEVKKARKRQTRGRALMKKRELLKTRLTQGHFNHKRRRQ